MKRKKTLAAGILGLIFSILQIPLFAYGTYVFYVFYGISHISKDSDVVFKFFLMFLLAAFLFALVIINFVCSIVSIKYAKKDHEKYMAKKGSTIFRIIVNYLIAVSAIAGFCLVNGLMWVVLGVTILIAILCGTFLVVDYVKEKKMPAENASQLEQTDKDEKSEKQPEKEQKRVCQYCKHKSSIKEEKCPHCGAYFE